LSKIKENKNLRVIIHYPNDWLLKQFSFKSPIRKIVWNKSNDNPTQIALNEWPKNIVLKLIFAIPFLTAVILSFIPVLLIIIVLHFINKDASNTFHQNYFNLLNWLAKNKGTGFSNRMINLASSFNQKPKYNGILRVLFLKIEEEKAMLKFDANRINIFIDEIWLYDSIERVIREVVYKEFLLDHSFITKYDEVNNISELEWINEDNNKIIAERERLELNKKLIEKSKEPQHPRIILNPNNFLNNDVVLYFESIKNKKVNDFIKANYKYITESLKKKSIHFLYIPVVISNINTNLNGLDEYAQYFHPEAFSKIQEDRIQLIRSVFDGINEVETYYEGIAASLNIPEMFYPVLLHSVELATGINPNRNYSYSIYELKGNDDDELKFEFEFYLNAVSIAQAPSYRVVGLDNEDPDDMFPYHGNDINMDLQKKIDSLLKFKNEKIILSSIIYMINTLKKTHPQLSKKINNILYDNIGNNSTLSRLYIDEHYKIFLIDYDNLEIELSPLPKALFFFMLKNPEGVRLKELSNHREELIDIYSKVGNRLNMDQVRKSINDLIDATSNSVNEKCSRIKEAFVSKIDNSIAQHYYITGNKNENKRIILDRSLVVFSQIK